MDGVRQMLMGSMGDFPLWLCFAVVFGFAFLFMLLSVWAFEKARK